MLFSFTASRISSQADASLLPVVNGKKITLDHMADYYKEAALPGDVQSGKIYLAAKGCDGGRRYYNDSMLIQEHDANDGAGGDFRRKLLDRFRSGRYTSRLHDSLYHGETGDFFNSALSTGKLRRWTRR